MCGSKAVPTGYKHHWTYRGRWNEKKIKPKLWKIDFIATKRTHARGYGNFKPNFRIKWKINAVQYAVKTGKGTYQTRMIGYKRPLKAGYKW